LVKREREVHFFLFDSCFLANVYWVLTPTCVESDLSQTRKINTTSLHSFPLSLSLIYLFMFLLLPIILFPLFCDLFLNLKISFSTFIKLCLKWSCGFALSILIKSRKKKLEMKCHANLQLHHWIPEVFFFNFILFFIYIFNIILIILF